MEWPPASSPAAVVAALQTFLATPPTGNPVEPLELLCDRLEELGKSDLAAWARAFELLADACRKSSWREPVEQSGLLKYYLEKLDHATLPTEVSKQLLRAVGNAVADRDESRAVVLPCLEKVVSCLQDRTLMPMAISVLYNVSLGYEPAYKEAAGLRLDRQLCRLLSVDSPVHSQSIELLSLVSDQLTETVLSDSEDCLTEILAAISACDDWDDYKNLQAAASVYLQDESIRQKTLQSDGLQQIARTLLKADELAGAQRQDLDSDEARKEFENEMRLTTGLVLNEVAKITADDAFNQRNSLASPFILEQGRWLQQRSDSPGLQTCACITLGNLAVSDAVCTAMVHEHAYHVPLIELFATATTDPAAATDDRTLLFLAAGFLRHLAQPRANAAPVAAAGAVPAVARLLARKQPELDLEVAAILRRLVNDSFENAGAVIRHGDDASELTPPSTNTSPTTTPNAATSPPNALIPALLSTTSQTKTAFEVGRLLVSLCRELRKAPPGASAETQELWARLLRWPGVTTPLALMARQEQVPALRSEALFGFSLMAASREGADCVGVVFGGAGAGAGEGVVARREEKKKKEEKAEEGEEDEGEVEGTKEDKERADAALLFGVLETALKSNAQTPDAKNGLALACLVAQNAGDAGVRARFEGLVRGTGGRVIGEVGGEEEA
ncbi:uncharacterized protein K452DRAFT_356293 [Aplosporella prunicola CBS 121167]|uniref:Uncharacterized protein n=1 Tax=Aplosporella prunicola CBS 121167 TaxID=1176127 RepID=A0A6A6BNE7_9PEZI|nr:uncharacterized protein K452DRAFT_356293 [Aplosporella prunicola CBS 121167]KAF2144943.1 hypothetical protein K452DRAFT_356293 [Aplosporella prunicola CBS 121167]